MDTINWSKMEVNVRYMYLVIWIIHILLEESIAKVFDNKFPRRKLPPKFYPTPTNVTYEKGGLAVLYCSVENLGTKTVIWRKQPYNIPITVGQEQFVEINRFSLKHIPYREEWNLLIKNVQPFDAGVYECQISSATTDLRRNITLNVVESSGSYKPEISIIGTRVVEKGNSIYLTCNASWTQSPPDGIDWYKDGNVLTTETRSDIRIEKQISITKNVIISRLTIGSAFMSDTGTYVCRTPDLLTATFNVNVLNHFYGNNYDNIDKRGMENDALTHGSSGNRNGYSGHSGQTSLHVEQIYSQLRLHHLLFVLFHFAVH